MPKRTNAFQRLVALLTATLAGRAQVTESAMLTDRVSGGQREVDILIEAIAGGYAVRIGIEVISWKRPADAPWVEKMRGKHQDLPTNKLILVSESGFSGAARRKAEHYGIEVLTIDEANEADWPLIASLGAHAAFEVMTITFDVVGILLLDDGQREQIPIPVAATFNTENGTATIDQLIREFLGMQDLRDILRKNISSDEPKDFWFSYTNKSGLWRFKDGDKVGQFVELRVGLKVLNSVSPVRVASGKFRSVPFISGTGMSGKAIQFVLAKNDDGTSSGYLFDGSGVKSLWSDGKAIPNS